MTPTIPRLSLDMASPTRRAGSATSSATRSLNELGRRGHRDRVACMLTHDGRRCRRPGLRRADEADRAVLHRGGGPVHADARRLGRWSRTPAAAIGGSCRRRSRCGSSKPPQIEALRRRGLRRDRRRRRRDPGRRGGARRLRGRRGRDRQGPRLGAPGSEPRRVRCFVLSTGVEQVAVHFRQPDQRFLDRITVDGGAALPGRRRVPAGEHGAEDRGGDRVSRARRARGRSSRHPATWSDAVAGRDRAPASRPTLTSRRVPWHEEEATHGEREGRTVRVRVRSADDRAGDDRLPARLRRTPAALAKPLGNDTSLLRRAVPPAARVLEVCRAVGHAS